MSAEGFLEYADDVYQVVMTMDEAVNAREAFFTTWKGIDDLARQGSSARLNVTAT